MQPIQFFSFSFDIRKSAISPVKSFLRMSSGAVGRELKLKCHLKLEGCGKFLEEVAFHFDFVDDSIVFRKRLNWHFKAFLRLSYDDYSSVYGHEKEIELRGADGDDKWYEHNDIMQIPLTHEKWYEHNDIMQIPLTYDQTRILPNRVCVLVLFVNQEFLQILSDNFTRHISKCLNNVPE
jgi:hypothetical protein